MYYKINVKDLKRVALKGYGKLEHTVHFTETWSKAEPEPVFKNVASAMYRFYGYYLGGKFKIYKLDNNKKWELSKIYSDPEKHFIAYLKRHNIRYEEFERI